MITAPLYFVAKKYVMEDPDIFLGPFLSYEEALSARSVWQEKNFTTTSLIIMETEIRLEEC